MRAWKWHEWLGAIAIVAVLFWLLLTLDSEKHPKPLPSPPSLPQTVPTPPAKPTASAALLSGYADPASPPIEDLRKLNHVITGYFSVIKDSSKNPIGGNADLAAALRGENPNRTVFLPVGHPIFNPEGLLIDRWDSPVIVHPQSWRQIDLRSAGPDKIPYNADDLILTANGAQQKP